MSDDKRGMPVSSFVDALGKGDDSDINQIVNKMISRGEKDKDLPLMTNVDLPFELAVLDAYCLFLRGKGYVKTARYLRSILLWYRLNKCSEKGWRSEQVVSMVKAMAQRVSEDEEFNRLQRLGVRR